MAKNNTSQWDTTAGNNTDVGGINIAENCPAANMNNALREMMKQIADARTGSDTGIITGTAGSTNSVPKFNADGDLVEGGATLTSISALGTAANKGVYFTAAGVAAEFDLTAAGRALLDDVNEAAQRTTLGLGQAAIQGWSTDTDFTVSTGLGTDRGTIATYVAAQIAASGPSLIWATIAGGVGPSVTAGNGVSGVARNGAGLYTITFSSAFSNANYAIFGVVGGTGASATTNRYTMNVVGDGAGGQEKTTTTVQVYIVNPGNGAAVDPNEFYIQAIGT